MTVHMALFRVRGTLRRVFSPSAFAARLAREGVDPAEAEPLTPMLPLAIGEWLETALTEGLAREAGEALEIVDRRFGLDWAERPLRPTQAWPAEAWPLDVPGLTDDLARLRRAAEGRVLTPEQLERRLKAMGSAGLAPHLAALLQVLVDEGTLRVEAGMGVERRAGGLVFVCRRCGTVHPTVTAHLCEGCGTDDVFCPACAALGPIRGCTAVLRSVGEGAPDRPAAADGHRERDRRETAEGAASSPPDGGGWPVRLTDVQRQAAEAVRAFVTGAGAGGGTGCGLEGGAEDSRPSVWRRSSCAKFLI
ncbi:MAG: hypothetical protein IMW86_03165 [Hydrogenibacillus sp.]|nr:hypothetical protein [Hydrogenibacillus sp.]